MCYRYCEKLKWNVIPLNDVYVSMIRTHYVQSPDYYVYKVLQ